MGPKNLILGWLGRQERNQFPAISSFTRFSRNAPKIFVLARNDTKLETKVHCIIPEVLINLNLNLLFEISRFRCSRYADFSVPVNEAKISVSHRNYFKFEIMTYINVLRSLVDWDTRSRLQNLVFLKFRVFAFLGLTRIVPFCILCRNGPKIQT